MKFRHALILVLAKILGLRVARTEAPLMHFIDLGKTLRDSRRFICIEEL